MTIAPKDKTHNMLLEGQNVGQEIGRLNKKIKE